MQKISNRDNLSAYSEAQQAMQEWRSKNPSSEQPTTLSRDQADNLPKRNIGEWTRCKIIATVGGSIFLAGIAGYDIASLQTTSELAEIAKDELEGRRAMKTEAQKLRMQLQEIEQELISVQVQSNKEYLFSLRGNVQAIINKAHQINTQDEAALACAIRAQISSMLDDTEDGIAHYRLAIMYAKKSQSQSNTDEQMLEWQNKMAELELLKK